MCEIGLPARDEILQEKLLVTFYDNAESITDFYLEDDTYIIIGDDYVGKICIQQRTDHLFVIDTDGNGKTRFINSSIEAFLIFLQIYLSKVTEIEDANDEETWEILRSLRNQFTEIDANARDGESDSWWFALLDDIELRLD